MLGSPTKAMRDRSRGSVLVQAEEWVAKKKSDLDRDEIAFVEASLSLAKREAGVRQAAQLADLKRQAAISQSLRLAVAARGLVKRSPETALLVAGEAILLDHNAITDEVLRESADGIRAEVVRLGMDVVHVAFTPDHEILTLSADGEVRRFDDSGRPLGGFRIEGVQAVLGGACSPDGARHNRRRAGRRGPPRGS